MRKRTKRIGVASWIAAGCALAVFLCAAMRAEGQGSAVADPPRVDSPRLEADPVPLMLDAGFHQLYELNFQGARAQFLSYQKMRQDDPMGKAAEAASYLYEQFNTKGVFTSEFFLNDAKFLGGADGSPAQNRNEAFLTANESARNMAKEQLKSNPGDSHALLVLTMTDGMEADYDALIVKKQMAGLGLTKQAESEATKLLAIDPSAEDAYLALGAGNYIIGSLPSYKRAFLWFGGIHGDRVRGMEEMQRTADHGHYLQPFAKILLALAYEREHQMDRARVLLAELASQFPTNPLFARELALVDQRSAEKP
jgi:hypothetical protein